MKLNEVEKASEFTKRAAKAAGGERWLWASVNTVWIQHYFNAKQYTEIFDLYTKILHTGGQVSYHLFFTTLLAMQKHQLVKYIIS